MLAVERVNFSYGKAQALHDLSFAVGASETVALVGRNGAGKSTTMRVLAGLLESQSGTISLDGMDITKWEVSRIARQGMSYVPEDRQIFPNLTAMENLQVAALANRAGSFGIGDVFDIFPQLGPKRKTLGENLSGGEKQMLAIARALVTNPRMLLLDEPTEGLAPVVIESVIKALRLIQSAGVSMLVVEQNFKFTSELASRQYLIDSGRIVWSGTTEEFTAQRADIERMLVS